jgi:cytochrome c peroxidase
MRQRHKRGALAALALLAGAVVLAGQPTWAQFVEPIRPLGSLKKVATPEPPNLNQFLKTNGQGVITPAARASAIALGKALFWDQAVGSDGQACASCHFNAGADSRTRNQVDPGIRAIPSQTVWGAAPPQNPAGAVAAPFTPDYQLRAPDFPLTKFVNQLDHTSGIVSDTQAVVSSQGVYNSKFGDITLSACPPDQPHIGAICDTRTADVSPGSNGAIFSIGGTQVRNVEPRNTPTVINAVFNYRNFWDGRARNEFNGVNPIGDLDPFARVLINAGGANATLQKVALSGSLRLTNAALASQSVGPALSDMEMSAQQRSFAKLGKKMLALPRALPGQVVAPDDSVLGNDKATGVKSLAPLPGLNKKYADLIQAAFQPQWYGSNQIVTFAGGTDTDGTVALTYSKPPKAGTPLTTNQYTQMEFNFSLFWGIAIQMYEATLRADDSPMDQAFDSGNALTFTLPGIWDTQQKQGMNVFMGAGKCLGCHSGPETTNAAIGNVTTVIADFKPAGLIETMTMADLTNAAYDDGFYNTGVRRCDDQAGIDSTRLCDDGGVGTTLGPLGLPLSLARFSQLRAAGDPRILNVVCVNQPAACDIPFVSPFQRVAVDGAFKTPGLRNVELTAPYMHNGGELSLKDVVDFYQRGGNFPEYNIRNLDPDIGLIQPCFDPNDPVQCPSGTGLLFLGLGLSDAEKDALVAFMKAMTDERVRYQRAPFDHPQLFLPNLPLDPNCPKCLPGEVPAVGRNGITTYNAGTAYSYPQPTFFNNLAK